MNRTRGITTLICTALILMLTAAVTPALAKKQPIEKYQANALAVGGPVGSQSSTLSINIYEWSDEDDRELVVEAIKEATDNKRAYRAVPDTLRKLGKAGYMFLAGGQGWPIRYAQSFDVNGQREIVLATDRPVTFSEVYAGSAVRDFDITLMVLKFEGGSSTGEGIVSVGTEIKWNESKDQLEITNFSSQPVRLGNVRPVE
jgi:hypothetical protein